MAKEDEDIDAGVSFSSKRPSEEQVFFTEVPQEKY